MGINIKGENVRVWRKDFDNGCAYSVSSSTKLQDGTRANAYTDIRFTEASGFKDKKINNGTTMDFEGFYSAKVRKDGTKVPLIVVMSANIKDEGKEADTFEQLEEEIPF